MLKHLFTPEEARIATQLSMIPEPLNRIYRRVKKSGISIEEFEQLLDHMVDKGAIMITHKGDEKYYSNAMLAVGMFEFQVERLTRDFAEDMLQYIDEAFGEELYRTRIPQLRTIPIEKNIPHEYHISFYDDVRQIVDSVDSPIAVANCVCRQTKDVVGESCSHTDLREACLLFGEGAQLYIDWGVGRPISKEEAIDILGKAQEAGLVLQPANSQQPEFICCCCGDCCGILTTVKRFPRPAELYVTNYYSEVEPTSCTGCEDCVGICQLDALVMVDSVAVVNLDRCIGCGNCVALCPADAIRLHKKEQEVVPPRNTEALYMNILSKKVGRLNMLKIGTRTLLKLKI